MVVSTVNEQLSDASVLLAVVTCTSSTHSTVCELLQRHIAVVRDVEGRILGVGEGMTWTKTEMVVKILE